MADRYRRWLDRKLVDRCAQNLKRNGFDVRIAATPEAGCRDILAMISEFESFGIGGSETVRALGLVDRIREMGKTVFDHWEPDLTPQKTSEIRLSQGR